jgi:hypothetical protein
MLIKRGGSLFMRFPDDIQNPSDRRTQIPAPDDFAAALMEEWGPSAGALINERRALTEDPATLRLARSF